MAKQENDKTINERQRDLMAAKRLAERDIQVPDCEDIRRRDACLADPALFLQWYFPHLFRNPFTTDQLEIIDEIHKRMRFGGRRAIAADRGGGKSTITAGMIIYGSLAGLISFSLLLGSNDTKAVQVMRNVKSMFHKSERLMADFPMPCLIAARLKRAANAASGTTVNGQPVDCQWGANQLILPFDPQDLARQLVFVATGWQSGDIRGQLHEGKRPDFIMLDDLDTRKSADSADITKDIEATIEEDVTGLAGPGESLAIVMLCTRINRRCAAFRYTSPDVKPSWAGKVYKLVRQFPERMDLWEKYVDLRVSLMQSGKDPDAREAFRMVRDNFDEMHKGAEVSNPFRAIRSLHEDGEPLELSTIQFFMNKVADAQCQGIDGEPVDGWKYVLTEYNNEPSEEDEPIETGATEQNVAESLNGLQRGAVPRDAEYLTAHVDVHKRHLTWTLIAWVGTRGHVVDYGDPETVDPEVVGVQQAILRGLRELKASFAEEPYHNEDGDIVPIDLVMVDCGYQATQTKTKGAPDYGPIVHEFLKEAGEGWIGSRGVPNFKMPEPGTPGRKAGHGGPWYRVKISRGLYEIHFFPDFFKHQVHDRFLQDNGTATAITLYGSDPFNHKRSGYARQVAAQCFFEEWSGGKKKTGWKHRPGCRDDHYLDTTVGACVAACVLGVEFEPAKKKPAKMRQEKPAQSAGNPAEPQQEAKKKLKTLQMVGPSQRPSVKVY